MDLKRRWFLAACITLAGVPAMVLAAGSQFRPGDQVMVFFPSPDVQRDAFIIGIVKGRLPDGRYRIRVTDYVEGHDYGLSCEPLPPETDSSEYGLGWEKWDDTRTLSREVDYAVPADKVMPAGQGRMYAISRNNVWTTFARWLSEAPVLYVDKLKQAQQEANEVGLSAMQTAFELAIAHRQAFYSPEGAPYWPWQAVERLVPVLERVQAVLARDPELKALFMAKPRDWQKINQRTDWLFTLRALDKIVDDVRDALYEEGLEKVDPKVLRILREKLKALGVSVR
ncbi:MAG TPA: hypothetical protein EYH46_04820 [Sulfurivirga caldicuralii]|nr:hypothetical protein [Sulfurivirga caldicuralii]